MDLWPGSHSLSSGLLRADITCGKDIRLGLNCVGGESTMAMAGLLGNDAHLVTYGAMAKRPVPIPASFHIFKNLTSHGFWLSRWYRENGERQISIVDELARIMASGKVSSCVPLSVRIRSIRLSSSRNQSMRLSPLREKQVKNEPRV